ncbi:ABC transporter C family member 2-like [Cucumis melo var. makuwa]|uniref:ABC transporter C family member 2-like n=1 Tax=Cucumis melo var. makuwa TaxID=1194695 RepID=A0A5D3C025_CUCMM|nr:ABC transporter C family member 2-like [Cucumis melo var. makuwa]
MAFKPFFWYCRPVVGGVWTNAVDNAFGAYTPCAIDSLVVVISHLVVLGLCIYRIWLINKDFKVQRFCLKSGTYNYVLCLLATCCAFEPLLKLIMGISVLNLDGQTALAPFEVVALMVQTLAWCSMVLMLVVETKVYVYEFRWIVRFGVVYILVADIVMLNLILSAKDFYKRSVLYLYISEVFFQALFGVLLLPYVPSLDPYPGHTPLSSESVDVAEYEKLPDGEDICPERHVSLFSKITFAWMDHIMKLGYKRPLTEKDFWKLDMWDRTETLYDNFQKIWVEESHKSKPWLLRALNSSLGGRNSFVCSRFLWSCKTRMVVVLEHVKKFLNEVMAFYHTLWILVATSLPGHAKATKMPVKFNSLTSNPFNIVCYNIGSENVMTFFRKTSMIYGF